MNIAIIFPCYNGGDILKSNISTLFNYIQHDKDNAYSIYVVNDGSTDNTLEILRTIKDINVLSYDKNLGKGGAVKHGILNIKPCDCFMFMDVDFSTDITYIKKLISAIKDNDIAIGSRYLKDSIMPIKRSKGRRFVRAFCRKVYNMFFHYEYKDTQCGFKMFKYDVGYEMAKRQIVNSWSFDLEYLYFARLNNLKVKEVGVKWICSEKTTIKFFNSAFICFRDLFRIKHNKKNYILNRN